MTTVPLDELRPPTATRCRLHLPRGQSAFDARLPSPLDGIAEHRGCLRHVAPLSAKEAQKRGWLQEAAGDVKPKIFDEAYQLNQGFLLARLARFQNGHPPLDHVAGPRSPHLQLHLRALAEHSRHSLDTEVCLLVHVHGARGVAVATPLQGVPCQPLERLEHVLAIRPPLGQAGELAHLALAPAHVLDDGCPGLGILRATILAK
mmetsp:Transcript_73676/g.239925  ORF Transcript_73676/g.239925 Transcript_73676/m.239925 type:complete len:204 (+) Transcript_73676:732-1343(+)